MGISMGHLLIVLALVLIVFGVGKLPRVMGDLGKGLKAFKAGMNDTDEPDAPVAMTTSAPKKAKKQA